MAFSYEVLPAITLAAAGLVLLIVLRPGLTAARGGKILAFIALFIMPVLATWVGASAHLERSKTTSFCLSYHVMAPYGQSLHLEDTDYLPAGHFQNHRVPPEEACYTCHTQYTLFGDFRAKPQGTKHLYVY